MKRQLQGTEDECRNSNYVIRRWAIRDIIIRIVEKVKETSSDTGMHNRAITVLHEQWMCLGMQRHTHMHITLCNLVTIIDPYIRPSILSLSLHKLAIRLSLAKKSL